MSARIAWFGLEREDGRRDRGELDGEPTATRTDLDHDIAGPDESMTGVGLVIVPTKEVVVEGAHVEALPTFETHQHNLSICRNGNQSG